MQGHDDEEENPSLIPATASTAPSHPSVPAMISCIDVDCVLIKL